MAALALRLLGSFQATLDESPLVGFESSKVRALLAYLGTTREQQHQRSHLAALLWPEMSESRALGNLRHALANLRRLFDDERAETPILLASRHAIQINPAADVCVDVVDFRRHLLAAEAGESPIEHRKAAIALYQDAFLQGLRVRSSAPWDEWVSLTREALSWEATEALDALVRDLQQAGETAQALGYARRRVQLTPWNEEAQRQLIRLLALMGQRSAALAQFDSFRQILASDLAMEPEAETLALVMAIRNAQYPPISELAHAHGEAGPAFPPPPRFVARSGELSRLEAFRQRSLAGQAQIAFITGEAGSGKSALAAAFGRRVLEKGDDSLVVWGESNAFAGQGDPFLPFRDVLLALIGDAAALRLGGGIGETYGRRLQRFIATVVPILLATGPELIDALDMKRALMMQIEAFFSPGAQKQMLLRKLQRHPSPSVLTPSSQPQRFIQFSQVLMQLAQRAPLVIILDDLQWADAGSLSLLFHLGHRLRNSRILLVGLFRSEDVLASYPGEDRHPLALIVREFQRRSGDVVIDLDRSPGRAFVNAYLDSEPNRLGEDFRRELYRHTGGHALFTAELLSSLQEQGYLYRDAGAWRSREDLNWQKIPVRVEAIIADRIARLPENWRTLLIAASVAADDFSAEALARMLNWPLLQVQRILNGLVTPSARLLAFRGRSWSGKQRLNVYRFRHILFQSFLYYQMSPAERAHWHEEMGMALEEIHGDQTGSLAPALARHFEIAQSPLKAARYYLLSGQQAMNLFAPEEALALYSRGLALLQQASDSPAKVELEMALQMAISDPLVVIQGWGAAEREQASQRAYELCKQSGNEQALIRALYLQADMLRARGRYARSLALGKQLLSLAEEAGAEAGLALAHWTLGETQFFRGKKAPARFHLTRALAHYTPPDPGSALRTSTDLGVVCQVWLSWLDALEGRPEQGEARLQEALALARRLAQPFTLSFAIFMGAYGFWWLRKDPQAADAYATEAAPLMMAEELAGIHPWGRLFQGWVLSESGALAEGIAMMEEGMDMWTEMGAVSGRSCQGLPLVRAYLQAEQREKARALTADILAMMEETGEQMFTEEWRRLARAVQTPEQ